MKRAEACTVVLEDEVAKLRREVLILQEQLADSLKAQKQILEELALLRLPKPEEPKPYNGTRDEDPLDDFLWDMEQYLEFPPMMSELEKVQVAARYLIDGAKLWWRTRESSKSSGETVEPCESWAQMKQLMTARFRPTDVHWRAREQLLSLRHNENMRDYINAFIKLLLKLKGTDEETKLFYFMHGLQPWAQYELNIQKVATLNEAFAAADRLMDFHSTGPSNKSEDSYGSEKSWEHGMSVNKQKFGGRNRKADKKCFCCDSLDHLVKDCPHRRF